MIIVKTSNGDKFVNDKAALLVDHDKESKTVHIIATDGTYTNPPIDNVEAVIYTNDANPTQWRDEGSELAKMRETVERFRERLDEERTLKNSYNRSFYQACRVIDLVKYQLDKKESARTWDGIEDCMAEVEKIFEELHQEREKITDKRLAPCRGEQPKEG